MNTREHADVERPGFFPRRQIGARRAFEVRTRPEDSVAARLTALGIRSDQDVAKLVLSHLHHDRSGALTTLGATPVYLGGEHWRALRSKPRAEAHAAVTPHWPPVFTLRLLEPAGPALGPWPHTYPVTADGRVFRGRHPRTPEPGRARRGGDLSAGRGRRLHARRPRARGPRRL